MRKMIVTVVLAAVVVLAFMPTASKAEAPAGTNILGIYTTTDNTGICWGEAALAQPITAYLCLSGCGWGASGIAGYEFRITLETAGGIIVQSYQTMGTVLNLGSPPEYICGLAAPLTPNADGLIVLMQINMMSLEGEGTFALGPITSSTPSIPGNMALVSALDPGDKQAPTATSGEGAFEGISFGANTGPIAVPNSESTWGDVKSLYR